MDKGSVKSLKYDSKRAHIILIITVGLYMSVAVIGGRLLGEDHRVLVIFLEQAALIIPSLIWFKAGGAKWDKMICLAPLENYNIRMAVSVIICAYPIVAVINFFTMLFVENALESIMPVFLDKGLWLSLLIMALMPAFNEEFLCRGLLFQSYRKRSVIKGALLSSIIFGLLHMNLNQMPYAIFLGFIFALMVEATGSVMTSMLMHFMINGFNVLLNYYVYSRGLSTEDNTQVRLAELLADPSLFKSAMIAVVIILLLFVPLTAFLIYKTFKINKEAVKETSPWEDNSRLIDIPLIVLMGFLIILSIRYTVFL